MPRKTLFEASWYSRSRADRIAALVVLDMWLVGQTTFESMTTLLASKGLQPGVVMTAYVEQAKSPSYRGPGTWLHAWMWNAKSARRA